MSALTAAQIRQGFIDFFTDRGHAFVRSSPVLPEDNTLLFTNAGMNQFKDVFLGTGRRAYTRAANSQKCIRAGGKHNDLEDVGRDTYHQTFFEMLGNWSFGDYYKAEAIQWAWQLLTEVWGLPKDKLYATVHHSDDEAAKLWPKLTGIPKSRVLKFGDKENFWMMANTGPCGPCSEIHIDLGPKFGPEGGPNTGSARYIELWNLVFIQYDRDAAGTDHELPAKHVDTGMGLERVCSVIQKTYSNYETDLFAPIIEEIVRRTGRPYRKDPADDVAIRAIADHARTLSVAIADGVMPSSDDRGYVLRRILRRAARFGRRLGLDGPFVHALAPAVSSVLGGAFPEVKERQAAIVQTIRAEEELFERTIDAGLKHFEKATASLATSARKTIAGEVAYKLHSTYGFPIDLTRQMAEEQGLAVDEAAYAAAVEEDKERSRRGRKFNLVAIAEGLGELPPTEFTGYKGKLTGKAKVLDCREVTLAGDKPAWLVVLDKSPFYAESGGQVGDTGSIVGKDATFTVDDVLKHGGIWLHFGQFAGAVPFAAGTSVDATVDVARRRRIEKNHSATHLLHWALHTVVGPNATQQGSLVEPGRLRFDFASPRRLEPSELERLEAMVCEKILVNEKVSVLETSLVEAKAKGAMALFGEKYGDRVRMVSIGKESIELCGGTHVERAGDIGGFRIASEGPVQAGVRRIVAVTGMDALRMLQEESRTLAASCALLKLDAPGELPERIEALQRELKAAESKLAQLAGAKAQEEAREAIGNAETIKGVRVVLAAVAGGDGSALRKMGDEVKKASDAAVGFFVDTAGATLSYLAAASPAAVARGIKAGDLLRAVAAKIGGGGGGRPDLAQGGGGTPAQADEALAAARSAIETKAG